MFEDFSKHNEKKALVNSLPPGRKLVQYLLFKTVNMIISLFVSSFKLYNEFQQKNKLYYLYCLHLLKNNQAPIGVFKI